MAGSPPPQSAQASASAPELDNALWRFVLPFYSRDGVSAACLALQEKLGVDVNILLFAIFAQVERGILLERNDLAAVDALVRDWRNDVIQLLRRVRTRMKSGPSPAPSPITEALRNRIKAAELEAEKIEIAMLADWLDRQLHRPGHRTADTRSVPLMVARYFLNTDDAFAPEVDAALDTLSQAMRDVSAAKSSHLS
jgi:uncharacterized protein (TIGR02444 family)